MGKSVWIIAATAGVCLPVASELAYSQAREPAHITNPTHASRSELAQVVTEALRGAPVTLADDALIHSSSLIIEPARPRDGKGRLMQGRELRKPERFQLLKEGSRCVLVHTASGREWLLHATTCASP